MWEEYFPNAEIIGLDIDPACASLSKGRCKVIIGDQSDVPFLTNMGYEQGPFDLVIDDGSHLPAHMLNSFMALAPHLSVDAYYVIEDMGGLTGDVENSLQKALVQLIDGINFWPRAPGAFADYIQTFEGLTNDLARRVVGISFYRYICFMQFGRNPEDNPFLKHPSLLTKDEIIRIFRTHMHPNEYEYFIKEMELGYFGSYIDFESIRKDLGI
jgi:hypothetical protein